MGVGKPQPFGCERSCWDASFRVKWVRTGLLRPEEGFSDLSCGFLCTTSAAFSFFHPPLHAFLSAAEGKCHALGGFKNKCTVSMLEARGPASRCGQGQAPPEAPGVAACLPPAPSSQPASSGPWAFSRTSPACLLLPAPGQHPRGPGLAAAPLPSLSLSPRAVLSACLCPPAVIWTGTHSAPCDLSLTHHTCHHPVSN